MTQRVEDILDKAMPTEERKSTVAAKGKTNLTFGISRSGVTFSASTSPNPDAERNIWLDNVILPRV